LQKGGNLFNSNTTPQTLPWTGERYLPEVAGDIRLEHLHRYLVARELVQGKDVLDIACGEGYGSRLLAEVAKSVTGMDISQEVVAHASTSYLANNLHFAQGDCAHIPLRDASLDVVVSFETLEHHDRHHDMIAEIRRVLRPGGLLLISTPDKLLYSDRPGYHNAFHIKELYADEFHGLLTAFFSNVVILGQRICYASVIAPPVDVPLAALRSYRDSAALESVAGLDEPIYLIAVATDGPPPTVSPSLFDGTLAHRADYEALLNELAQTRQKLEGTLNSIYWRMTFPLRGLRKLMRKVFGI
jgi:SAM-dependent methyltransferase